MPVLAENLAKLSVAVDSSATTAAVEAAVIDNKEEAELSIAAAPSPRATYRSTTLQTDTAAAPLPPHEPAQQALALKPVFTAGASVACSQPPNHNQSINSFNEVLLVYVNNKNNSRDSSSSQWDTAKPDIYIFYFFPFFFLEKKIQKKTSQ